jgi:hypothetical protein
MILVLILCKFSLANYGERGANMCGRRENGEHKMAEVMGMWTMNFIPAPAPAKVAA